MRLQDWLPFSGTLSKAYSVIVPAVRPVVSAIAKPASSIGNVASAIVRAGKPATRFAAGNVKKHWRKYLVSAVLAAGIGGYLRWKGESVYDGIIDGAEVSYVEGRGLFDKGNVLNVKKNGIAYKLTDSVGQKGIEWMGTSEAHFSDSLESVAITDSKGTLHITPEDATRNTQLAPHARVIMEKSNRAYNKIRENIRKVKRGEYNERVSGIEKGMGELEKGAW